MKKLLYVYSYRLSSSGVNLKLNGQIKALKITHSVKLLTPHYNKEFNLFKKNIWFLIFQIRSIFYSFKFQTLYIRYSPYIPLYNISLLGFSYFKDVFIEHNSIIESELLLANKKVALFLHKVFFTISNKKKIFHVCVTKEIGNTLQKYGVSDSQIKFIPNGYDKPTQVISKIDFPLIEIIKISKNKFSKTGVFVGNNFPWHGIDVVDKLFRNEDVLVIIVGGYKKNDSFNDNFIFTGNVNTDTLVEIYKLSDFGIGPMNLQLLGITEACPLKVREYLVNGLPVLINYREVVEENPKLKDYVFNLSKNHNILEELILTNCDKNSLSKIASSELAWGKLFSNLYTNTNEKNL